MVPDEVVAAILAALQLSQSSDGDVDGEHYERWRTASLIGHSAAESTPAVPSRWTLAGRIER